MTLGILKAVAFMLGALLFLLIYIAAVTGLVWIFCWAFAIQFMWQYGIGVVVAGMLLRGFTINFKGKK